MQQTLFTIPREIGSVPVFGFGWLFGIWLAASLWALVSSLRRSGWGPEVRSYLPAILISGVVIAFVLPRLLDARGLPIRGYGVMLLIAVMSGVVLSVYRARQMGIDPEIVLSLAFWMLLPGIVGARLFYIVEYWDEKYRAPTLGESLAAMINIAEGGLVVYGGMIAAGVALIIFVYKNRLPCLAMSDLIAPGVVLGMALGRIGCFLNGCCYGGACELPWAVRFPMGSPPHFDQLHQGKVDLYGLSFKGLPGDAPIIAHVKPDSPAAASGLRAGERLRMVDGRAVVNVEFAERALEQARRAGEVVEVETADGSIREWTVPDPPPRTLPVHPTQIYSSIDALLLCLFLLAYYPFRKREGELTALLLTIHPISRFLIEIIRTDEAAVFNTPFSISQNISLAVLMGAIVLWAHLLNQPRGTLLPRPVAA